MEIYGLNKVTLLDYPKTTACTVFTGGCNFRCPFCHNSDLVYAYGKPVISEDDFFCFLHKRKNVLEGVCISGGEPTLNKDLPKFIEKIKNCGYKVKLDTNGSNYQMLKDVLKLVDYVAMDIKNCTENYAETVGIKDFDVGDVKKSAALLMASDIPYEFRTTVVKEFHNKERFKKIGEWLSGAKAYYLQQFVDNGILGKGKLNPCSKEEMNEFLNIITPYFEICGIRGI
jgi:pyruvate formate lyase activating enzyme